MAERVAPVLDPVRPAALPQARGSRRGRWLRRGLLGALILLLSLALAGVVAHYLIIDRGAKQVRATALLPDGALARVLVVVAQPGDELQVAGTIRALTAAGAQVTALSLTAGELAPPTTYSPAKLARIRAAEFTRSTTDVLGASAAVVADNADGSLLSGDPAQPVSDIARAVRKAGATTVIVVPDLARVDTDGQALEALAREAAQSKGSTVGRIWVATKGAREVDWINKVFGPVLNPQARTEAEVAVRMESHGAAKAGVILAHGTQSPALGRDYPGAEVLPAGLYFRFLDREYFNLVAGDSLG